MKITNPEQLSALLQNIRITKGISQTEIANEIGLRQATISNFENNPHTTKLETLFKILYALDLEVEISIRGSKNNHLSKNNWEHEW